MSITCDSNQAHGTGLGPPGAVAPGTAQELQAQGGTGEGHQSEPQDDHCAPLGPEGTDLGAEVSDVLERVRARPGRDEGGRWAKGNVLASSTLARSKAFWDSVAVLKANLVAQLRDDLAVDGVAAQTLLGLLDGYAEARLLRHAMFDNLAQTGGAISMKGKIKSSFNAYLQVLDRETKLATTLGLARRAKSVQSVADYIESRAAERSGEP